ncbi:DUF3810 family protein [Chryseobacterium sp. POE27]|uniref:DUF3810 family protein n=1 Tax=Chryseobacterium sp. POE27 TaxID=3138177 RepID=UPI00321AFC23
MDTNTTKKLHKKRVWAGLLLAQFLLFFMFSRSAIMISFFERFFEIQKKLHQLIFAWIPFSFGDVLYILLGVFLLYHVVRCFSKKTWKNALLKIFVSVNIFYFIYQIFWGMLYFQTPIINKLPSQKAPTLDKAKALALQYLQKCKDTRKLTEEDKNGIFIITNLKSVQEEILFRQTLLPENISNKKSIWNQFFQAKHL